MENEKVIIEKFLDLFENSFNSIDKLTNSILKFYYSRYKFINRELLEHNLNKPIKIFKRRYNKWLKEKESLEKEKIEILNKLNEEYKELK